MGDDVQVIEVGQYRPANPTWLVNARKQFLDPEEHEFPFPRCPFEHESETPIVIPPFGERFGKEHFLHSGECVFLNHGSYGGTLKRAWEAQKFYQQEMEKQTIKFFEHQVMPLVGRSARKVAHLVNCAADEVVFVPNATTAVTTVVRSLHLPQGAEILAFDVTYASVKSILYEEVERVNGKLVLVKIPVPLTDPQVIVERVASVLQRFPQIKFALLDHITSMPSFTMPLAELIPLLHSHSIRVMVDGAHAIGNVGVDLQAIGADYYTSNLHKWMCVPKGVAFLYVKKEHQSSMRPWVISHGYGLDFTASLSFYGTYDYSGFMSIIAACQVIEKVGLEAWIGHNHALAQEAAQILTSGWSTSLVFGPQFCTSMACIYLPDALLVGKTISLTEAAKELHDALRDCFHIEVPVGVYNNRLFVRVSGQVYNERKHYEALRDAVVSLINSQ